MKETDPSDQTPEELSNETGERRPETGDGAEELSYETGERTGGSAAGPWRYGDKPGTGEGPEELLRHLDAQISMQRARKKAPQRNRTLFLVSGFLFIVAAAAAALMILEEILSGQAREGRGAAQSQTASERNF